MNIQLLIPAAGMGRRLGLQEPKALAMLGGEPLVALTLRRLQSLACTVPPVVVVPPDVLERFEEALASSNKPTILIPGGKERQDSVSRGLAALDACTDIVVIHDAARPFVSLELVLQAIDAASTNGAATLAMPVSDTILQSDSSSFLLDTPDRSRMWACQTPQVFKTEIIRRAYAWASETGKRFTDDATLVKHAGYPVRLIESTVTNFKITTPGDFRYAEYLLEHATP